MNKYKIGQEVEIISDYEISDYLTNNKIQVKNGDKGFIDSKGNIHYTTGAARGKIHFVPNAGIEGYDIENITDLIYTRIKNQFNIKEYLDDYEIEVEDFKNEIEDVLTNIF